MCIFNQRMDKKCGDRTWKAAQNALGTSRFKVDQTGLSIVTCRHMLAQKALNMYRGEIFAYAFVHQVLVAANMLKSAFTLARQAPFSNQKHPLQV